MKLVEQQLRQQEEMARSSGATLPGQLPAPWAVRDFRPWARIEASGGILDVPVARLLPWVLSGLVVAWPLAWVAWAFLLRGGLSLRLAGLSLVGRDGRPAARWRCAWRALLVWGPVTALLLGSIWLDAGYWSAGPAGWASVWLLRLSLLTWWALGPVLAGYVALALRNPARGPHDRLAGTYLVPR